MAVHARSLTLGLAALALLAAPAAGLAAPAPAPAPAKPAAAPAEVLDQQMTLGNPKAKVEVVEYASASCPHCAHFALDVFPAFKKKYIDSGQVHFVFREMLTSPPELAAVGFLLSRCAGRARYFQTLDKVFESQKQWQSGVDLKPIFVKIGQSEGLTPAQFDACMADQTALKALQERVTSLPEKDKVTSTPTFFVNGQRVQPGTDEISLPVLDAAIAAAQHR